jgi:putative transposase
VSLARLIAAQRVEHGIPHATSCRAVGVSQAWFYKWVHGDVSLRRVRRAALAAQIEYLFAVHHRSYGSPRITADLHAAGWRVSPNTVAALMAERGLVARPRRRRRSTTRRGCADASSRKAPDALRRDFTAETPDTKWCGDLTEIPTDEGRFYLAAVLDLHSRRCVGFAMDTHHDTRLARAALCTAIAVRGGSVAGVLFHTDQGGEGGFNWSSQHLDHGGVGWDDRGSRCRRRRPGRGGSGPRIGRCGRRCARQAAQSRRELCNGSSGA